MRQGLLAGDLLVRQRRLKLGNPRLRRAVQRRQLGQSLLTRQVLGAQRGFQFGDARGGALIQRRQLGQSLLTRQVLGAQRGFQFGDARGGALIQRRQLRQGLLAGALFIGYLAVQIRDPGLLVVTLRAQGLQIGLAQRQCCGCLRLKGQRSEPCGLGRGQGVGGLGQAGQRVIAFGGDPCQPVARVGKGRHRGVAGLFGLGQAGQHFGQRGFALRSARAHLGQRQFNRLALGGGQPRGFLLGVDFIAGAGQRNVQRLGFGHQRVTIRFGRGQLRTQIRPFGDQRGHLRLEGGDLGLRCVQFGAARLQIATQRGDRRFLLARGVAQAVQVGVQPGNPARQAVHPGARQAQGIGQAGHLRRQAFKLKVLIRDRFAHDALNDHEDRQDEHQNQQERRHGVDEARPDRARESLVPAAREAHHSYPSGPMAGGACRLSWRTACVSAVRSLRRSAMDSCRPAEISSRMRTSCTSIERRRRRASASI